MENTVPTQDARNLLNGFLSQHVEKIPDFTNVPIEDSGILDEYKKHPLSLTHFEDLYDTIFYSNLIKRAIELSPEVELVVDFGAGSSIPTLLALKQSGRTDLKTIAVDVDPEAKVIGAMNAQILGLDGNYTFHQGPMSDVLESEVVHSQSTLIVSNPPYIPAPATVTDHHLVPINGGEDGTRYMIDILSKNYPAGTTLALLWGSLTNPTRILPLISERYEVLHVDAVRIHFGKYTKDPAINQHLHKLRDEGKVVFDTDEKNGETQLVIGTILRARDSLH